MDLDLYLKCEFFSGDYNYLSFSDTKASILGLNLEFYESILMNAPIFVQGNFLEYSWTRSRKSL
jgi:hypothetical protein